MVTAVCLLRVPLLHPLFPFLFLLLFITMQKTGSLRERTCKHSRGVLVCHRGLDTQDSLNSHAAAVYVYCMWLNALALIFEGLKKQCQLVGQVPVLYSDNLIMYDFRVTIVSLMFPKMLKVSVSSTSVIPSQGYLKGSFCV